MSADGIAAQLGTAEDTVYAWIAERSMPVHKVGRPWNFQAIDVDAHMVEVASQMAREFIGVDTAW